MTNSHDDARQHPDFDRLLVEYLDELNSIGIVDPDRILADHPELGPALLVCVTELCSREVIDRWATALTGGSS